MKAFRINTDIKIKWTVSINGGTTPIEGTDLKLVVQSKARRQCLPFAIDGNTIVATFRGKDQVAEGTHSLTLWMNFNKDGQAALDHVDAFTLVPTTEQITDGSDSDNLLTDASVELTGELTAAVKGDSAYEIWLNHGFTGTVEDFLAWIKGPQGEPGTPGVPGNGIDHIEKTATEGKFDTYTIYFTDGTTYEYIVKNGEDAIADAYTKEETDELLAGKASSVSKVAEEDGKGGVKEVDDDTNSAITNLSYDVFNLSRSTENKANLNSQGALATGEEQRLVVDFINIDGKHVEVNIPGVYYNGTTRKIETYKRHGEGMMSIVLLELSEEPSQNVVYCDKGENKLYRWNGTGMVQVGGGGGSVDAYTKEESNERFAAKADLTAGRIAVDGFENLQEQLDNTVLFTDYPKKVNRIYLAGVVKVDSASGLTVDDEGFISVNMVQTTGTAADKVMSQKAVSDLIGNVEQLLASI